jgi:hypothetical protein
LATFVTLAASYSSRGRDERAAEVLRLHYLEGASVCLIAKKIGLAQ